MQRWLIILLLLLLAGLALLTTVRLAHDDSMSADGKQDFGPSSKQAFLDWANANSQRLDAHVEFDKFLDREGVGGVIPTWQLMRVDGNYASRCHTDFFNIPPREEWPNIVPALRLVRDEVIPTVGSVAAVSSWRSPAINSCVNGASQSRHLRFEALDMVALEVRDTKTLFRQLCELPGAVGRRKGMGPGAYFDPDVLERYKRGRFHIDASGYRSWGFG